MPKKQLFGSVIIIILLSFVCMYIYDNYKVEIKTTLIAENIDNCTGELKEYYSDNKKNKYYLNCLNDIIVDFTDHTLELNRALEAKQIKLDYILDNSTKSSVYYGDKVNFYQNNEFTILECIQDDNTSNYIFGNINMTYKESLCNTNPYIYSFTKTYYVLDISESNNPEYIYLTIKDNVDNEVATIKVSNTLKLQIEKDNYYNFQFASTSSNISNEIKEIFDNNTILSINLVELEVTE